MLIDSAYKVLINNKNLRVKINHDSTRRFIFRSLPSYSSSNHYLALNDHSQDISWRVLNVENSSQFQFLDSASLLSSGVSLSHEGYNITGNFPLIAHDQYPYQGWLVAELTNESQVPVEVTIRSFSDYHTYATQDQSPLALVVYNPTYQGCSALVAYRISNVPFSVNPSILSDYPSTYTAVSYLNSDLFPLDSSGYTIQHLGEVAVPNPPFDPLSLPQPYIITESGWLFVDYKFFFNSPARTNSYPTFLNGSSLSDLSVGLPIRTILFPSTKKYFVGYVPPEAILNSVEFNIFGYNSVGPLNWSIGYLGSTKDSFSSFSPLSTGQHSLGIPNIPSFSQTGMQPGFYVLSLENTVSTADVIVQFSYEDILIASEGQILYMLGNRNTFLSINVTEPTRFISYDCSPAGPPPTLHLKYVGSDLSSFDVNASLHSSSSYSESIDPSQTFYDQNTFALGWWVLAFEAVSSLPKILSISLRAKESSFVDAVYVRAYLTLTANVWGTLAIPIGTIKGPMTINLPVTSLANLPLVKVVLMQDKSLFTPSMITNVPTTPVFTDVHYNTHPSTYFSTSSIPGSTCPLVQGTVVNWMMVSLRDQYGGLTNLRFTIGLS